MSQPRRKKPPRANRRLPDDEEDRPAGAPNAVRTSKLLRSPYDKQYRAGLRK